MIISEVIEKIKRRHAPYHPDTCDTVKVGDDSQECTGIVTTCFASVEVIRKAAEIGANLVICHEPLFYSHEDRQDWLQGDAVYEKKAKLLKDTNIVVWRDHDGLHGGTPSRKRAHTDMIFDGIMKELGWEDYCIGFPLKPLAYEIPPQTAGELVAALMSQMNLTGARIVGDPNTLVRRVLFCEHIRGDNHMGVEPDCNVIKEVADGEYDALIPLEIVDWSLSAYVRDSAQLGMSKVIIELGHFNVEELAMRHMQKWLTDLLDGEIPVHFIQSGDSFTYLLK